MPNPPHIFHRDQWGARQAKSLTYRPNDAVRTVYGHYSDQHETIPSPSHFHDVLVVQAIQRFHMDVRGYVDIAYGALIGGNGDVYLGRPNNAAEAGVFGHNHDEYSICFLTDGPITQAQKDAFRFMLFLAEITFPNVSHRPLPHSAGSPTECPGDTIRAWLAGIHP